ELAKIAFLIAPSSLKPRSQAGSSLGKGERPIRTIVLLYFSAKLAEQMGAIFEGAKYSQWLILFL
ncbi:MAG: hypothetical protein GX031_13230, partial [Candidatus Riflebacteria bacterium]|nr:hypothetical protein [Candidatus Riflebacteria bacterium]